jgi:hypothetical protein
LKPQIRNLEIGIKRKSSGVMNGDSSVTNSKNKTGLPTLTRTAIPVFNIVIF